MPSEGEYSYPGGGNPFMDDAYSGGGFSLPSVDWGAFGQAAGNIPAGAWGSAVGTGFQFVGSLLAARGAKKAAAYNEEIIKRNATTAAQALENEAAQRAANAQFLLRDIHLVRQAQQEDERNQVMRQEALASQTRAIIGASGLMMSGSPVAVYEHNLRESQREIVMGRYRADVQERAIRHAATMEEYAASMARFGAGERLRVGNMQGALARYGGGQQRFANMLGAFGGLASGGARTYAALERGKAQRGPTLRQTSQADGLETLF